MSGQLLYYIINSNINIRFYRIVPDGNEPRVWSKSISQVNMLYRSFDGLLGMVVGFYYIYSFRESSLYQGLYGY